MMTDTIPNYLGGALSGPVGDEATYFPAMWAWLVKERGIESVLDIGCGFGVSTRFFRSLGCKVVGVDGVPQDDPDIVTHDYTMGPVFGVPTDYDLGWCCEFVEHVEERYLTNVISTFQSCKVVLMTHAFPGQGGHHHVNLRTSDCWLGFFTGIGFAFDNELTRQTKLMARKNVHPLNHYVRSGMAFTRNG